MRLSIVMLVAVSCGMASHAVAQAWPAKALRVVAPFPPGGPVDLIARITAQRLSAVLGQPVLVDNRSGAGGIIGTEIVAKSPADGYTLLLTTGSHASNPAYNKKLPYDSLKDFAPITMIGKNYGQVFVIHPSLPARSVQSFIALAKTHPEVRAATIQVAKLLEEQGHHVEEGPMVAGSIEEFLPVWQFTAANAPVFDWKLTQPTTQWLASHGKGLTRARVDEVQPGVVPRRQSQVRVLKRIDKQRFPFHADADELRGQRLRLGLTDSEIAEKDDLPFLEPLRERRLERVLLFFRVHFVGVIARSGAEDRAAVTMDGRTATTLAGPASALLPERLLARAAHFRAVLDLGRSLAERGEVVAHRFVDQVLFVWIRENRFRQVDRADLLVVPVFDVDGRHGHSPRFPFLEKRTTTRPLRPPGTAPRM